MSLFTTNHIFDTATSKRLDKHKGVQMEAEQVSANDPEQAQMRANEHKQEQVEVKQARPGSRWNGGIRQETKQR